MPNLENQGGGGLNMYMPQDPLKVRGGCQEHEVALHRWWYFLDLWRASIRR